MQKVWGTVDVALVNTCHWIDWICVGSRRDGGIPDGPGEVLSGTNSRDRRVGAQGILRGLLERGAIGLATTHDLALTEMAAPLDAANVHFDDDVRDGQMSFDYRMRPGVVQKSNALALMRAVGLDVSD
jgi:DNA mismatch repair ATPase MutS